MKRKIIIPAAALLILVIGCTDIKKQEVSLAETKEEQNTADNDIAITSNLMSALPSFTMQDISGNAINLQSFRGKKVFVNLWASWCPPCRAEMPSIEKLSRSVDTSKVQFVMLSLDDDFEKAKQFVKNKRIALPIYYPGEDLPAFFNVQGIPTTFIFNETGQLIQRVDGGDDYDSEAYRKLFQ